ncbi:hypothetical protein EUZ85_00830 [Hahella sp. KA22]|uniref:3'-5' exonuclease n=1 Tax=Hahella sp. KA22 TaxID=1628392 RepID=UPI000FDD5B11|nr:hypothetical protein [Hahella sp. KA22]AZZ95040.1 hypothetical protein ENC22_29120 [Hahella sp. KA22]QAY52685.1 hypothetical protein EUZ85_00830 [Hahella sp. KA22]
MAQNQPKASLPAIIDVEASGSGRGSYPIEVGFIRADGFSYCSLIKPQPTWTDWDESAQQAHGVSRQTLAARGKDVRDVARDLNAQLAGQTIYSDAWGQDFAWLSLLFAEAGVPMEFKVEPLSMLMSETQKSVWGATRARVEQMLGLPRHRASGDARILQMTYHWSSGSEQCRSQHAALGAA